MPAKANLTSEQIREKCERNFLGKLAAAFPDLILLRGYVGDAKVMYAIPPHIVPNVRHASHAYKVEAAAFVMEHGFVSKDRFGLFTKPLED